MSFTGPCSGWPVPSAPGPWRAAAPGPRDNFDDEDEDSDESSYRNEADDDYEGRDDEEEGYDDQYDEITFNREGR